MPQLRPFRGLRYASPPVSDYSAVICPPYDVISADERARLAARDPANAVHLELPTSYDEAARLFAAWQHDGTLRRDTRPLVYLYEMRFRLADGRSGRARGFLCRLGLGVDSAVGVRPHERTLTGPREDRFALLKAVRANLSPVILLWEAPPGADPAGLLGRLMDGPPDVEAVDDGGVAHRLWTVDPAARPEARALLEAASRAPLTIADGHHRYATAQRFCTEVGGPGADQVMALVFEVLTGGLAVLATHRLVKGPEDFLARARELFDSPMVGTPDEAVPEAPGWIGLWTRSGGALLRLPPPAADAGLVDALDVSGLAAALPQLTGDSLDALTSAGRISYTQDAAAAVGAVDAGRADAAFLLAPTPIEAVVAVAAAGQFMPPKSTFFYPKAATGLVFNPLAP